MRGAASRLDQISGYATATQNEQGASPS